MKLNHLKGFSLIELIVAISISIIVIGSIFTIFSNINLLEKITTKKSHEAIKIAYAYNLLKNDLSNSIPGIINKEFNITNEWIASKSGWTPYDNFKVKGFPILTIVNGEVAMRESQIVSESLGKQVKFAI